MSAVVQNICRLSQNVFSNFLLSKQNGHFHPSKPLDENSIASMKKIFSQITLNDLYYDLNQLSISSPSNREISKYLAPMTYTSVFENEFFSLTVFGFRGKSSIIPLHDHPGMYGFIKCVHGCLSVKSYTVLENHDVESPPMEILNKVSKFEHRCLVPSIYIGEDIISENDLEIGMVTPHERNLHEIKPISNKAVMVDIISPPYTDMTGNHYYIKIGTIYDKKLNQNITWLLKTLHTNEYYCDRLIYSGPSINLYQ